MSIKSPGVVGGTVSGIGFTGFVDNSGTPGNTTINASHGRAAIAAAATACVVTNNKVTAASAVLLSFRNVDATALQYQVVPGAGSFTVTANAAATGNVVFDFVVVT